jgi:hypothetical protein
MKRKGDAKLQIKVLHPKAGSGWKYSRSSPVSPGTNQPLGKII